MKQVLIADDSRTSRKAVLTLLQQLQPDWLCTEAENGEQACQWVAGQPFDLVILDIKMPKMDGLTAAEFIRRLLPDAYLCLLTADVQPRNALKAQQLGVHFVAKPISCERMQQIIDAMTKPA